MKTIVIVVFVIVLVGEIFFTISQSHKKKTFESYLMNCVVNEDYKQFDALIDSKEAIKYLSPFNRFFMKLNVSLLEKDDKKIKDTIHSLQLVKMSQAQLVEFSLKAFNYYVEKGNAKGAKHFLNLIMENAKSDSIKELSQRTYSIYIEKSDAYLDELLKESKELEGRKRAPLDLLLSKIYENRNDMVASKKYMDQYYQDIK